VKNVFDNFDEKKSPTVLPPSPFLPEFLKKGQLLLKSAYISNDEEKKRMRKILHDACNPT